ncbi:helix-turn-helix domain-containing protein [Streptomyces radicis]|uniref:XRE family transcriptional regulator n=1 Tax=Streptomyces radicis TaxID=1750517 RepID=A0A3A9W7H4_9ACTN|nr:helix-turn-helix transcriptional regulator [Streptomyces radicis]RKN09088.1 XRE family transcriptional regulator [Streptomyces radicis]RKN22721.1 XRE family transcriptional regulator [Streptomyces radicis]
MEVIDLMAAEARPNLMRSRLGLTLRKLRGGRTLQEAAELVGGSVSAVSRVELGKQSLSESQLDAYLRVYQVPEARVAAVKRLWELAASGRRTDLLNQYSETIDDLFAGYLELEEVADHADIYTTQVIPGLLQTEEYATALVSSGIMWKSERQVRQFVELRMARKEVLRRRIPLSVSCVIEEAALLRPIGDREVLRRQLRAIRNTVDELPQMHVLVLPTAVGGHCGVEGPFTVFRFESGDPVVVVESLTRVAYLEQGNDLDQYELAVQQLRGAALDAAESREFIDRLANE